MQLNADWEEGLPWLLLAAREVTQESTGFSPNELVFGHMVRGLLAALKSGWEEAEPPQNLIDYVNGFSHCLYAATELAKEKLASAQNKMKRIHDQRAEGRNFSVDDQVLALLPSVKSPFQAKFMGPYTVVKQLSEQNYLISMPKRRKKTQLCHVNLLKPYHARESQTQDASADVAPAVGAHPVCVGNTLKVYGDRFCEDGLPQLDLAVLTGRLKNSQMLANLDLVVGHLSEAQRTELVDLIHSFPSLFGDTPSCTQVLEHNIDVGEAKPIKQHFYPVNAEKRVLLAAEIGYMLSNGIAEPSSSAWASPCVLVPKPDKMQRFCTDYRKVNSVTKPDSYPLPRMDDCVDQVGSARFISKFDLLKGYWQVPLSQRAWEISAFVTPARL